MRKTFVFILFGALTLLLLVGCSDFQLPEDPSQLLSDAAEQINEAVESAQETATDEESAPAEDAVAAGEEPPEAEAGVEEGETAETPEEEDAESPEGEVTEGDEDATEGEGDAVEDAEDASLVPPGICPEHVFPMAEPGYVNKRQKDLLPYTEALFTVTPERLAELDGLLIEASIEEIQTMLDAGDLSSVEMTTYYLSRIMVNDINRLNSVLELNPEAIAIALDLDEERAATGARGLMHGIPVLLKDNIATGDGLHAAAGAYVLGEWLPDRDAFLVQQLRDAGAIILGKANLSEWANYMDSCMPNGFSILGGQTQSPYGPFDPLGSSTGSAVAVAANLVPVAVGTETAGSIIRPAMSNSTVAIKTSRGLVSRDYVIPLAEWLDVPGPIGRSVSDAAILLTAMSGIDENDPATAAAADLAGMDFSQFLSIEEAQNVKVGVMGAFGPSIDQAIANLEEQEDRELTEDEKTLATEQIKEIYRFVNGIHQDEVIALLTEAGIEYVEIDALELSPAVDVMQTIPYAFNQDFAAFMSNLGDQAPAADLAEVVALNDEDLANRAPYGQALLENAATSEMTPEELETLVGEITAASNAYIESVLTGYEVDVVAAGLNYLGFTPAGAPAITVPAGLDENGMPVGIVLTGEYLSEPQLIAVAYALEQTLVDGRVQPDLAAALAEIEGVTHGSAVEEETAMAEGSAVAGTVTYLQKIALPDDAVITVQIINASLADAPAEVLGEQIIKTEGQQVPIPYKVPYNADDINENIMYNVQARIEDSAGTLLFINDTAIPVITNGNPTTDVEIMTVLVGAPETGEGSVTVTGSVMYMERMALPDDAIVKVQIINASLADAPAEVLGKQIIETQGQQVPIAFEVPYNVDDIDENLMYSIGARIEASDGTLLFISDTAIPVITNDSPTEDVEIMTILVNAPIADEPPADESSEVMAGSEVTGQVTYLPGSFLPDDSQLIIQIQNASQGNEVIAEEIMPIDNVAEPTPFAIAYEAADIVASDTYTVTAVIVDALGRLVFHTDMDVPVITNENPTSDVEIQALPFAYG